MFLFTVVITFGACSVIDAQNVALSKPATQSGTFLNDARYSASKAVDGSAFSYAFADNGKDGPAAWIQVDLTDIHVVERIVVKAPPDREYRYLDSFQLTVDNSNNTDMNSLCYTFNNQSAIGPGVRLDLPCTRSLVGRYVTIRRNGGHQPRSLAVAEIEVYAIKYTDNRARYARTRQSGTYNGRYSGRAVDNRNDTCSLANTGDDNSKPAWWQVDLDNRYNVIRVRITAGTQDNINKYMQNIVVTVDDDNRIDSTRVCYTYNNGSAVSPGVQLVLNCDQVLAGRYVTIRRTGAPGSHQPRNIGFCDVQVIGDYIETTTSISATTTTTRTTTILTTTRTTTTTTTTTRPPNIPIPSTATSTSTSTTSTSLSTNTVTESSNTPIASSLTRGEIAGMAISIILGVVLLNILAFWLGKRCKSQKQTARTTQDFSPTISPIPNESRESFDEAKYEEVNIHGNIHTRTDRDTHLKNSSNLAIIPDDNNAGTSITPASYESLKLYENGQQSVYKELEIKYP